MVQVFVKLRECVFHNYIFKEIGESFVFNMLVIVSSKKKKKRKKRKIHL